MSILLHPDRAHTCCFSGSRPHKLGFNWQTDQISYQILRRDLRQAIECAIHSEYLRFITGMSQGFDLWAAEEVLSLQYTYPQIELICAIPFENMACAWPDYWHQLFEKARAGCSSAPIIKPYYTNGCYHARDRYMVEQSSRVICWYNGTRGGTDYTCRYAQQMGCTLVNVYPQNFEFL